LEDLVVNSIPLTADDRAAGEAFARLVAIMRLLRAPGGCPWDREQTLASLKPYLLEESYEVLEAIDREDWPGLCEELGDVLLQPVFQAQIASDEGRFNITDALQQICDKLVRRHPHVFGDTHAPTSADVLRNWEQIKRAEKSRNGDAEAPDSMLESVPRALPALAEAQRMTSRAAKVGFDWRNAEEVLEKLREELAELEEARHSRDAGRIQDELGDVIFVIVNLSRFLKVDAEQALRGCNRKFRQRFAFIEQQLLAQGKEIANASLEEMEALWQQAKQRP
jgi:tetrapyrrole methylase family protein / MazG family protein